MESLFLSAVLGLAKYVGHTVKVWGSTERMKRVMRVGLPSTPEQVTLQGRMKLKVDSESLTPSYELLQRGYGGSWLKTTGYLESGKWGVNQAMLEQKPGAVLGRRVWATWRWGKVTGQMSRPKPRRILGLASRFMFLTQAGTKPCASEAGKLPR